MEHILEKLRLLEDDLVDMKQESISNKTEILKLEKRCVQSERRIEELVSDKDGSTKAKAMENKIGALEQQFSAMERILEKRRLLEDDLVDMKQESLNNTTKLFMLEKRCVQSERQIEELEKLNAGLTVSVKNGAASGFTTAKAKAMENKMDALEQQCQDLSEKCESFSTLQTILNKFLLKAQTASLADIQIKDLWTEVKSLRTIIEAMQSMVAEYFQQHIRYQEESSYATASSEATDVKDSTLLRTDANLMVTFEKRLQLVKDHKVPLNSNDYKILAVLEDIANAKTKPACSIVQNLPRPLPCCGSHSIRQIKQECHSPSEAMEEYTKRTSDYSSSVFSNFSADTEFYYVSVESMESSHQILAINNSVLQLMDPETKITTRLWPTSKLKRCLVGTCYYGRRLIVEFHHSSELDIVICEEGDDLKTAISRQIPYNY